MCVCECSYVHRRLCVCVCGEVYIHTLYTYMCVYMYIIDKHIVYTRCCRVEVMYYNICRGLLGRVAYLITDQCVIYA